jgi:hypothetical protein
MSNRVKRVPPAVWRTLVLLAVFSLPFTVVAMQQPTVVAMQHEPPPPVINSTVPQPPARIEGEALPEAAPSADKTSCGVTIDEFATGTTDTHVVFNKRLQRMLDHPDDLIGRTVTVDGEMHRQFTDRVFTIQQNGWGSDLLVISVVPMSESVIPLEDTFERHKYVRLTGVLRPYDQAQLECLFGPLNTESRAGHSFVKNPVLIIGYRPPARTAARVMPPAPPMEREKPAPLPEPVTAAPAPQPEVVQEVAIIEEVPATTPKPAKLPKTASNLPFLALAGVFFIGAACSLDLLRREGAGSK